MRSSRLARRCWYAKRRKRGSMRIFTVLASIIIILSLMAAYAQKKVVPYIMDFIEIRTRSLITDSVESAIKEELGRNLNYEDVAIVERDKMDRIVSIQTNVGRLNVLSGQIAAQIQKMLLSQGKEKIGIPLGTILGSTVFSAEGPDIYVKFVSAGQVETNFKTDLANAGTNKTKHSICLEVKVKIGVAAPMIKAQRDFAVEVPLAETIIYSARE